MPLLPGDTVACLRLADDSRRFPFRPLAPGLFLIGSGPSCDLRLGESGIPAIHSVIDVSKDSAKIFRIARLPELVINGEAVESAALHGGDLIEVGVFRAAWQPVQEVFAVVSADDAEPSASTLAIEELLAKLEDDMALVESIPADRGKLRELLEAAQKAVEAQPLNQTIRFADYAARRSGAAAEEQPLDVVLSRIAAQDKRLDEICQVLEEVVRQQQLIATALQYIADQLDSADQQSNGSVRRASA
ncbi:MAG: hypothetical protein U0996_11430 [Planctomycetaceae bacterium]